MEQDVPPTPSRRARRKADDAKPLKEKNAKNEANPEKKWDEIMDVVKTSKPRREGHTQKDAKDSFQSVKKTCSDCHTVFVESEF
ncbi:MAG: hypothetical protein U0790_11730 [Isosphaeraceae bacterium]